MTQPRVTIVIPSENRGATWTGGGFGGDPEITANARAAAAARLTVVDPEDGSIKVAGAGDTEEAGVALQCATFGRGVLLT